MRTHTKMNPVIKDDIQRYKKNKLGSMLALLGIVFNCIYFMVLYAQVGSKFFYKWPIAIDVIYNLVFMLFVFLFSEQVKNYDRKMFWVQLALGAMQVVRIFWLPLAGVAETVYPKMANVVYAGKVLSGGSFTWLIVGLAGSAACVIASAIIGYIRARSLENFNSKLEKGEVSVEATLKELDEAEAAEKAKAAETPAPEKVEEVSNA